MSPATPAIDVRGLVKSYGAHRALDGIDLQVPAGGVFAVLGPNGAGKTTLVRVLSTLQRADAGTVRVLGHDVGTEPAAVRARIAVTGQHASVDEALTGWENLTLFARLLGLSRAAARRRSTELLEEFSLTDAARRPVRTYSGGMRRRLDIAASLIADPPLVFLDEPTTGLDPRTREEMWATVRTLVDRGTTVLLTTQYLEEADRLASRVCVVDRGRIVADDTPAGLKRSLGGLTLELTLADAADAPRMHTLLLNLGATDVEAAPGGLRLSAGLVELAQLRTVHAAAEAAGIEIDELGARRPTLDEVFFSLTGPSGTLREVPA
ncbi:ATP-binding cassette domain-containing protein [Nocardioides sp. zg-536]|uniref:ATP-binding cassette domain-containing protein n=1 Tax=Nocardioides faecalis TaxID=2803858 RepID=A0A939BWE0_9ACTN|nr:ATP-binding cassette domain-containing protein [Nocardioides faecalis]MBM9460931.1 ATP-binding cassette domain-containing protein [Nocardioides faecalis]MBS4751906.1 ATP-binding cassette domain-containing protein [Nocardioides faecalis]QVI59244.1 ATP-binding cassette domain-containing protein [Nocardioides faecalis]